MSYFDEGIDDEESSVEYCDCERRATHHCEHCMKWQCGTCAKDTGFHVSFANKHSFRVLDCICGDCQDVRMHPAEPRALRELLCAAGHHQLDDPFDPEMRELIKRRIMDAIHYGVWTWEKEAA